MITKSFLLLFSVFLFFRFSPYYPVLLEQNVALILDKFDNMELPAAFGVISSFFQYMVPIISHGAHFNTGFTDRDFFEGWYYKMVDKSSMTSLIVIPAVFFNKENDESHAFIMQGIVVTNDRGDIVRNDIEIRNFSIDEVEIKNSKNDRFDLRIGDNIFRNDFISLNTEGLVTGEVYFDDVKPLPTNFFYPSIMGFFSYVDKFFGMQCVHKVLVIDSQLDGFLQIEHNEAVSVNLTDGRGYIEGDYGSEFPSQYVWLSSNHFGTNMGSSILLSFAVVPIPNERSTLFEFNGFLGYIYDADKEQFFKYGSYTGAVIEVNGGDFTAIDKETSSISIVIKDLQHIVKITAVGERANAVKLWGPVKDATGKFKMQRFVEEMLNAQIHVSVQKRSSGQVVFEGIGTNGALEIQV